MDVKLRILRFNPETDRKGHWEEYNIEADLMEYVVLMQWLLMGKICLLAKSWLRKLAIQ